MLHTHCHPYIFLPLTNSRPHPIPTACRLPIHSSSTQSTKFHITVSITQQLHHMHKYNNSKSLFSHNCNNQKSLAKTPKQCFSQTTNCIRARLVITPIYNVPNMLHDALNCQKHLPLSTSFHASIMQHVHLQLHYRHHPTQAFTGLPPRRSLLPTPIGSTHRLCMKLIHVPTEHTLQYYKIIFKM